MTKWKKKTIQCSNFEDLMECLFDGKMTERFVIVYGPPQRGMSFPPTELEMELFGLNKKIRR